MASENYSETLPILAGEAVQVKCDHAFAQRHFGDDPLRARQPRLRRIEHSERTPFHAQHCDIGVGPHIQIAQLRPLDLLRRRPGAHANHIGERRAQRQNRNSWC